MVKCALYIALGHVKIAVGLECAPCRRSRQSRRRRGREGHVGNPRVEDEPQVDAVGLLDEEEPSRVGSLTFGDLPLKHASLIQA